ncbi:transcription factor C2H2 [Aspergillus fumigatus]|nr:transcription factor C2H2 [Aspergillus fumigatus]
MTPEKSDAGQGLTNDMVELANRREAQTGADETSINRAREVRLGSAPGQTKCSICHSTFRRPEHLKRHFRSHTKEKPFECAQCGRHFSRTDTLHRHELSHHTLGPEGGKDRMHRITVKTFRACYKCAVARVRCSGGSPCVRCENRSLECQYPTERRSKAKTRKEVAQNLSSERNSTIYGQATQRESPSSPAGADVPGADIREQPRNEPPGFQITEFQLDLPGSHRVDTPSKHMPAEKPHGPPRGISSEHQNGPPGDETADLNARMLLSDAGGSTHDARVSLPEYASLSSQQFYSQLPAGGPQTLSQESASQPDHRSRDIQQPVAATSNLNLELEGVGGQQMQLGFDPPFLDQSMLSTLNWLPNDMFPDTTSDQSLSRMPPLSDQLGILDEPVSRTAWLPPVTNLRQMGPSARENHSHTPSGHLSLGTDAGSPDRFSHSIGEGSLHSEPSNATKRSGDFYVDGAGARLPKYRRNRTSWSRLSAEPIELLAPLHQHDTRHQFSFPLTQEIRPDFLPGEEAASNCRIEAPTYDRIYQSFLQLCRTDNPLFLKFETGNFPSADALSSYVYLYFDSFQPVYPLFHPPTFNPNKCHWLVTLAISAVGCRFSGLTSLDECTTAFDEFLRRAINIEAMALSCIGLLHSSGCEQSKVTTLNAFGDLVNFTIREGLLCAVHKPTSQYGDLPLEQKWQDWVEDEIRRRTGYLIWLLDCSLAYYFDNRPLLSSDDGQCPLPSHENLWNAQSAEAWRDVLERTSGSRGISLYKAVLTIYIEKKLVPGIGEFSHVLLIHALYHRMWEVGDYFRRPLSFWNPTAKKQTLDTAIPSGSVWLPGIPSYSKWRNSACDCLDILHWTANSTIAKAAGLEHPTVLHLHAARIVLLAPFREIRSLATSLAMGKIRWSDHQQALEWHYILRWIKHDQYKARLAIIHAGTTLWHVRRYSTNAFHEPVAVYLSILTLWAYGSCHAQIAEDPSSRHGLRHHPVREPTFIHLDRPCDDELVQLFVREGHAMQGNVTGVGDICAPHGPERILEVGCETLAGLTSWGISKRFIAILTKLAELSSQPQAPRN